MVSQQVLTKSRLGIEEDSKGIVLVVCDGVSPAGATMLANEVAKRTVREGKHRTLLYVISPLGRPEYFEVVKSVIQENIGLSISIRYSGSKPKDLLRLISRLGNPDVIVAGLCGDFIQALDNAGYGNIAFIHPSKGGDK